MCFTPDDAYLYPEDQYITEEEMKVMKEEDQKHLSEFQVQLIFRALICLVSANTP